MVSFNNTYKTNRFKLSFFQVISHTYLKTVFNAVFGFIDNKRLEKFQFFIKSVRALTNRHIIRLFNIIIINFDL